MADKEKLGLNPSDPNNNTHDSGWGGLDRRRFLVGVLGLGAGAAALAACGGKGESRPAASSTTAETTQPPTESPGSALEEESQVPTPTPEKENGRDYDGSLERDEKRDFTVDYKAIESAFKKFEENPDKNAWQDIMSLTTPFFEEFAEKYVDSDEFKNPYFMPFDPNYAEPQASVSMHSDGPGSNGNPSTPEAQMAYNAYVADQAVNNLSISNVYDTDGQLLDGDKKSNLIERLLQVAWNQPGGSKSYSEAFENRLFVYRGREDTLRVGEPVKTSDLYERDTVVGDVLSTSGQPNLTSEEFPDLSSKGSSLAWTGCAVFATDGGKAATYVKFAWNNEKIKGGPGLAIVVAEIVTAPSGYCDKAEEFPEGTDEKLKEIERAESEKVNK